MWRKLVPVEGSLAYPSYPERANFFYISFQNLANHFHGRHKVGSAIRVSNLGGSPFLNGRLTLPAGPTYKDFILLSRVNSVKARQSEHPQTPSSAQGHLFSHITTRLKELCHEIQPN